MVSEQTFEILIAGEDRFQAALRARLSLPPYTLRLAENSAQVRACVARTSPHLILAQFDAPGLPSYPLLTELTAESAGLNFIFLAAEPTTEAIVKCLQLGARDFLKYPEDLEKLPEHLAHILTQSEAPRAEESTFGASFIVGTCEKMQNVAKMIKRLSRNKNVTVLILGETGTGKEVIARALHRATHMIASEDNFVELNCTAIPETLLEAELFGYEKGAFTDAKTRKLGLFETAEGGSLFLDEIGDMSLNLQAKLLKAIEEKKFRRLGGTADIHVNTRIIAGTNADLKRAVEAGGFRRDLYYRLNVINIELPPLRERGSDILLLAKKFLRHYSRAYEMPVTAFTPEAESILLKYPWPGNVRELKHAIERAVLLGEQAQIEAAELCSVLGINRPLLALKPVASTFPAGNDSGPRIEIPESGMSLKEGERRLIEEVLSLTRWNRTKASEILGISRPRLKRKIDEYRIEV